MIRQQMKESLIPNTTMFLIEENKEKYYEFIPDEGYFNSSYSVLLNDEGKVISGRRSFNTDLIKCTLDYDFKNTATFKTKTGVAYIAYGSMEYCAVRKEDIIPNFVSKDKIGELKPDEKTTEEKPNTKDKVTTDKLI